MTAVSSKFPEWIKRPWASGAPFDETKALLEGLDLHTVCQSARCPNMAECWGRRTATVMVLGNTCSRSCRYCSVAAGALEAPDAGEPARVAEAVRRLQLKHTVITSVTRDDLPDGGADHIAQTIDAIREASPGTTIEILVPDFLGDTNAIARVVHTQPEIFSHNIETVERLHQTLRGKRFNYSNALRVLETARNVSATPITKSAFMVGHGETEEEVVQTMRDLRAHGCEVVSIGQYLRPSKKQREVHNFVHPDTFARYEQRAYQLGFQYAVAGPFVRSSFRSETVLEQPFAQDRFAESATS
jgi:lipoyl synthase